MDLSGKPSDTSYSQTNIPAPSINHNPLNVAAQLESDSAEHCVPARKHNRKALNWRPNEDIALCQAWVRCSENLIIGTSQTGNSLWNRIFEVFCEQLPGTTRTKKSLENRWTTIQDDVTKWKIIVNRVHKDRSVGTNPVDEWGVCYKAFRDDHTRAFKFYHCWEILHHSVRWNDASSGKCQGNPDSRSDAVNAPPPLASLMHDSSGSMDLSQPSSDSSHSQTNVPTPPSVNHNPPNVTTQIESASAEQSSVPVRPHNRKSPNWRPNEDIALCQAWVQCAENLNSQIGNSLWNRIFEYFCEKLPGTTRTKKSLENRWTSVQDDVTEWNAIVNRGHRDRSDGTNPADEWGVCYKAFRDDHTRDFKFFHCWDILHHSVKWNDGKSQDKPFSGSDPVNAPPPSPPASPMLDSAGIGPDGIGVDNLHDSSSMPSVDDDPSSHSTPTEPTLNSIPSEALESPLGIDSVREKRRRVDTCTSDEEAVRDNRLMDEFFECMKMQQRQIQMLQQNQELNMTQLDGGTKPVDECHTFHLVKKIKLEQLKLSVDIIQAIGDTEEKMISCAPHLMSDEVLDGQAARLKKLHELERKLDEIWQLKYSPGGNARYEPFEGGAI